MGKKQIKLNVDQNSEHVWLLGISSHENDYRLSWALNKHMPLNLSKANDVIIPASKNTPEHHFSCYSNENENTTTEYLLISNRSETGYFSHVHKNIDFLLRISSITPFTEKEKYLAALKQIDLITMVFELDISKIKNFRYVV